MPPKNDPDKPIDDKIFRDAIEEMKAMGKEGLGHPSTKPVVIGGAVGGVAGAVLLGGIWPLTLLAGAGFMLYRRIRP
jgi:hypothetical protein